MQSMLHLARLRSSIEALSRQAQARRQQAEAELTHALRWLETAPPPVELRTQLAQQVNPEGQAAIPPLDLPLTTRIQSQGPPPRGAVAIGVDGSQITPDRHAVALYYLLQIGGLIFRYNGQAPTPYQEAELHFAEHELYDDQGLLIAGQLGMRRTIAEMTHAAALVEAARAETGGAETASAEPILALTDGPLLWPYGRSKEGEIALPAYFAAFDRLRGAGGMPVGFVERPGGRALLELLWQSRLDAAGHPRRQGEHPLKVMDDELLMQHVLAPGERSIWLTRPSPMNERHAYAGHPIWFCYLNLGEPGAPIIARVEAPRWAAEREAWAATLHAVLLHQAHILHGNPYVLARAHELALVTHQDKAALESLLHRRLLERGIIARTSEKARQKSFF